MPGQSIGTAFTQARRTFVGARVLNPFEQKTALQFILLGDPTLSA